MPIKPAYSPGAAKPRRVTNIDEYWRLRGYPTGTAVPGGYVVGSGPKPRKPKPKKAKRSLLSYFRR